MAQNEREILFSKYDWMPLEAVFHIPTARVFFFPLVSSARLLNSVHEAVSLRKITANEH